MDGTLKYYMFDWDDNILEMPTKIRIRRDGDIVEITTSAYAALSDDERSACTLADDDHGGSFKYFRDEPGTSYFESDLRSALKEGAFKPSFAPFKQALIDARLFGIVTARGHEPDTFRNGVRLIITETFQPDERQQMIDNIRAWYQRAGLDVPDDPVGAYLQLNGYYGVTSPSFQSAFADKLARVGAADGAQSPSAAKTVAVDDFVTKTLKSTTRFDPGSVREAHFGFSDAPGTPH